MDIDKSALRSLVSLASVVEVRDPYTGGHLWRVGQFSKLLAEKIGLSKAEVFSVSIGAILHDLGKVAVPDAILRKPESLTNEEYAVIKTHPVVGKELLESHPMGALALDAVHSHHEHFDGRGYPNGLEADQIPLFARIVGVTDAFDAMTSSRPYRKGMPIEKALNILQEVQGQQFDAKLVGSFIRLHQTDGKLAHIVGHSDHGSRMVECPCCGPIIAVPSYFKDGEVAACRNCGGKAMLHRDGDGFKAESIGSKADAAELMPHPESHALEEFVQAVPKARRLCWFAGA